MIETEKNGKSAFWARAADVIDTATGAKSELDELRQLAETLKVENIRLKKTVGKLKQENAYIRAQMNLTTEQKRILRSYDDCLVLLEDYSKTGKLNQARARKHFGINSLRYAHCVAILRTMNVYRNQTLYPLQAGWQETLIQVIELSVAHPERLRTHYAEHLRQRYIYNLA